MVKMVKSQGCMAMVKMVKSRGVTSQVWQWLKWCQGWQLVKMVKIQGVTSGNG